MGEPIKSNAWPRGKRKRKEILRGAPDLDEEDLRERLLDARMGGQDGQQPMDIAPAEQTTDRRFGTNQALPVQQQPVQQQVAQQNVVTNQNVGVDHITAQAVRSLDNFSYTMTLNTLPSLKGDSGSDSVRSFFKQFDVATEEWPEGKRLSALRSKCHGKAERAFNAAVSSNSYSYSIIREAMIQQLDDTDSKQMNSFDELMNGIHRKPNETTDELGERVAALVHRAYPGAYQINSNPELAVTLELSRRPGATFDEFIAFAARAAFTHHQHVTTAEEQVTFQGTAPSSDRIDPPCHTQQTSTLPDQISPR
uniref:Gag protein n=1 Tax=Globodera rostochiensis TaxID=31243 RepID=A0A914HFF0_GLORO